ncbi:MAG: hypothetical protein KAX10_04995 [Candidatus Lokiarchaeota archaeon]|nr:hypothetical protein [Candidatus Lokiarchaeota archaeon]
MRIIPVIDLLNSIVVHAIAGKRETYSPLFSVLIKDSSDPIKLIEAYIEKLSVSEIYIADLDSILKNTPNLDIIKNIINIFDIDILLDPGIKSEQDLWKFYELGINKLILGTETILSMKIIENALDIFKQRDIIVSIDLKKNKLLTQSQELKNLSPFHFIKQIQKFGVSEVILLDLSRVGKKTGNIPREFLEIRNNTEISLLIGGGIKDFNDILKIEKYNFSGVLLATAIHEGLIKPQQIKNYLLSSLRVIK